MDWELWEPKYIDIVGKLGIDPDEDRQSARIMSEVSTAGKIAKSDIKNLIDGKKCVVFGAGPSLELDLKKISQTRLIDETIIAADGATSAVMEYRTPDIIVTDLDGNVEDQIKAWSRGAWIVIHAHGDNIDKIKEIVPQFDERFLGTTQVKENFGLKNFGGFTDGDRAVFMAHELGAEKIYLAGMDLGKEVGKFSGTKKGRQKLIKLQICKRLLSWLSGSFSANIVNLTSEGEDIPHIERADINSLINRSSGTLQ